MNTNKTNKNNIEKRKQKYKLTKKNKSSKGGYLSTITPYKNINGEDILPIPVIDLDLTYFHGLGSNPPTKIRTGKNIIYNTHGEGNSNRDAIQFMFPMYNFKDKLKGKGNSYVILKQFEGDESYYIVASNNYNPEISKFLKLEDDLSLQEIDNPVTLENPSNSDIIKNNNVKYKIPIHNILFNACNYLPKIDITVIKNKFLQGIFKIS